MASDRFGLYSASFTHAGGTLDLQQLREQSVNTNSRFKIIRPGGGLNPAAHILSTANPTKRFYTSDLVTALTTIDIASGLACSGGSVMRYQKRTPGGAFATGGSHLTQTTPKGFLHITGISVDIDSEDGAEAELEYVALSSDGTNPVTNTESVNFAAAPVPAFMSQYYLGGQWLDSTQVESLVALRVNPGIVFQARRVDGGVFPRYGASSIVARNPQKTMSYLNAALGSQMGSLFANALGATVKSLLQRATTSADGRLAMASTNHIRIDVAAGTWGHEDIRASGENDAVTNVTIRPTGTLSVALGVASP